MAVVSADQLLLSHAVETSPGVLPASPEFHTWRTTGESLVFAPQTSDSGELGGSGRFQKPATVTGTTISGSINFELAKFPALEEAIAGVMAAAWGECPLTDTAGGAIDNANRITVGDTLKTFTIEKRFPNPAYVAGTTPTASAGASGTQTTTVTVTGTASVGTGVVVVHVMTSSGVDDTVAVPIAVGDDATKIATALSTELGKDSGLTVSATTGTVTIDANTGNTITSISAQAGGDQYFYQRYKGASYSALSLSVSPNNPVTGNVTIVGGAPELGYLPMPGSRYVGAGSNPVFTAPQVLNLDVGTALGIGTHCWTSLNIDLDSQNRGIACIGTQGDREVVLGTLSASVSGDVYFSDQAILQALLDNDTIGDSVITLSDAQQNIYRWDFFGMKPTSGQVAAGGAGQDLTIPLTLQPTPRAVCDDGAGSNWDSGLILSTINTLPPLPAVPAPPPDPLVEVHGVSITSDPVVSDSTVVNAFGPAIGAVTATFTYQIDGGADQTFTVNIVNGDTTSQIITKIENAAKATGDLDAVSPTSTTITITKGASVGSLDALSVLLS